MALKQVKKMDGRKSKFWSKTTFVGGEHMVMHLWYDCGWSHTQLNSPYHIVHVVILHIFTIMSLAQKNNVCLVDAYLLSIT